MPETVLIVGLGNPGDSYSRNRHNAGFLYLDYLLENNGGGSFRNALSGSALTAETRLSSVKAVLIKPFQYMNRSGEAAAKALQFYKIRPEYMIVAHDEIELPFNSVKLKTGGGHKGHNGIRDIIEKCGGPGFARIRLGVGRPEHKDVASYVLSDFTRSEQSDFPEYFSKADQELLQWLSGLS